MQVVFTCWPILRWHWIFDSHNDVSCSPKKCHNFLLKYMLERTTLNTLQDSEMSALFEGFYNSFVLANFRIDLEHILHINQFSDKFSNLIFYRQSHRMILKKESEKWRENCGKWKWENEEETRKKRKEKEEDEIRQKAKDRQRVRTNAIMT